MAKTVRELIATGVPAVHRSEQVDLYRSHIAALDPSTQWEPGDLPWSAASLARPTGRGRKPTDDKKEKDQ